MADHLHDADDMADDAWVAGLLRESTDSLADTPPEAMPPEVWSRLENALEAERVVVPLGSRTSRASSRSSGSHRGRWVAGVAAAAAVVIGGGLLVSNTSQAPAPVAGGELSPADSAMVKSGAPLPTSRLLASGTDYSAASLGSQITSLFRDKLGVRTATDIDAVASEPVAALPGDDFMSDMGTLQSCVQTLAGTPEGKAIVVDRGSFAGQPAGLIVISTWDNDMPAMVPPSALVTTPKGELAVWVVDPTCTPVLNAEGANPLAVSVNW